MACLLVLLHSVVVTSAFAPQTFSAGVSEGELTSTECTFLDHKIVDGDLGALTYFWITGESAVAFAQIKVYVDGEATPSLTYQPAKAAGVGIGSIGEFSGPGDAQDAEHILNYPNLTDGPKQLGPWSNKWFGQLGRYAYFNTFRVPFQREVRVTVQSGYDDDGKLQPNSVLFVQVRGVSGLGDGLRDIIPGFTLPSTARLKLHTQLNVTYQPLDYMTLADVATGSGAVFATSLSWSSTSTNTIEGCVRAFTPHNASFPGMLISTGWEDYYITSWGMIEGPWQGELSGTTHWSSPGNHNVSVYRFHTQDPLFFSGGVRLILRNGETKNSAGQKCLEETGGHPVGTPGTTVLSVYAWVYEW